MQVLQLTNLSVFYRLLTHLLMLCVLQLLITFLVDHLNLPMYLHKVPDFLQVFVLHLSWCQ